MKVAVVGVTGMVGQVMLQCLEERQLPITELIPVASARSVGKEIDFCGSSYSVLSMKDAIDLQPDIALFSAGGNISREFAPQFAAVGTTVIDNSSAWRMDLDVPLIVPEVNASILSREDKIIANPNCSTIQLVLVLKALDEAYGLQRVLVSTYQSVTGSGVAAFNQLMGERQGLTVEKTYPHTIDLNCIPHCDVFLDNDYTKEEMKITHESRKILGLPNLQIAATAVRVPVVGGHSESVAIELQQPFTIEKVKEVLSIFEGITVVDKPSINEYPMPLTAQNKDDVFVGRIRRNISSDNGLLCWIVSDNLRKGAATNAVQIANYLVEHGLVD